MSLLVATQITAVATAVLAAFAIVTAVFAILAFRKQSAEVTMLQDDRQREAGERRRAQAAQVFVAVGGLTPDVSDEIRIHNTSEQPIYDLAASWADDAEPTTQTRVTFRFGTGRIRRTSESDMAAIVSPETATAEVDSSRRP